MAQPKHLQFLRSSSAGHTPSSLRAGEIAFNFVDKILFVGDGTSFYTDLDGTQTASSTPLEGWFAVDLDLHSDVYSLVESIGVLADLNTTDKSSIVAAINEVLATANGKIDAPTVAATEGQVLSWVGGETVWQDVSAATDNQTASEVPYTDTYEIGATDVQAALDALALENQTQATNITAAQTDATSALEGLANKQDSLPAGTDGQFLSLVGGSPTWANIPTDLVKVQGFADVAAFSVGAGYSTVPEVGDVVVIADAFGLLQSDPNYAVLNLYGSITEHVAVSLIASAQGQWLMLGTPGSVTQAIADVLYTTQSRTISAGTGLTGGGNLSADRTISIADNGVTYDLIQQTSQKALIGAGTAGDVSEITLGTGLDIVDGVLVISQDFGTF